MVVSYTVTSYNLATDGIVIVMTVVNFERLYMYNVHILQYLLMYFCAMHITER